MASDLGSIIEEDVTHVFAEKLPPTEGGGFRFVDPAADGPLMTGNERVAVIAWEWSGTHEGLFDLDPTHAPVTVRGVTLATPPWDNPLLYRYVDWLDALGQIGISVSSRPIVDIRTEMPHIEDIPEIERGLEVSEKYEYD